MVKRVNQEAARRPPSIPGLSRRSGRIPVLPSYQAFRLYGKCRVQWFGHGQRLQHHLVHERKDGRRRFDPQCQCDHPCGCEPRCLPHLSQRLSQIHHDLVPPPVCQCESQYVIMRSRVPSWASPRLSDIRMIVSTLPFSMESMKTVTSVKSMLIRGIRSWGSDCLAMFPPQAILRTDKSARG